MFIELHMIQNFAPSNMNRDDTGNPKDTVFGGVRRARISSQCIKRSIRNEPIFEETTRVSTSDRTRWITRLLVKPLIAAGKPEEEAWRVAEAFTNALNVGTENDKKTDRPRSKVLLFLSKAEIQSILDDIQSGWSEIIATLEKGKAPALDSIAKDFIKTFKGRAGAPDIALFGRMLAEEPKLSIDASSQVAHAISTHRVNMEMDFYTAVDELTNEDETGAGMLGVTGFNSACFYRYTRIDWTQLVENLNFDTDLARATVDGFLKAALCAVPTGKQNAFAAQNPPSFSLAVVRKDGMSWSLVNAFENPVRAGREGGFVNPSIQALDSYWGRLERVFGTQDINPVALSLADDHLLTALKDKLESDVGTWIDSILNKLPRE